MISKQLKEILQPESDNVTFSWSAIEAALNSLEAKRSDMIGTIAIDSVKCELTYQDGNTKKLTTKEFGIIDLLNKRRNTTVTSEMITIDVWGQDNYHTRRSMNVFMVKIKNMINRDDNPNARVVNRHGIGYVLMTD